MGGAAALDQARAEQDLEVPSHRAEPQPGQRDQLGGAVRTYRELFRAPEFMPFFLASSVQAAAQTMSSLALSTLIYAATGSPLLSALALFGPSLTQLIGPTLRHAPDWTARPSETATRWLPMSNDQASRR